MELFLVWVVIAIFTAVIASSRGRSAFGWFLLGMCFSLLATLLVVALPSRKSADGHTPAPSPATHIKCPDCKELVLRDASVCKHCGCRLIPQ